MPHRQNIGTGIMTRRGEKEDQNRAVITDKVTEQPQIKVGGVNIPIKGRSTTRREPIGFRDKFLESALPGLDDPSLTNAEALALVRKQEEERDVPTVAGGRGMRKTSAFIPQEPTVRTGGLRIAPPVKEDTPVTQAQTQDRGVGRGVGRGGGKGRFNILNFEGISNVFNSAGELAAFFASPEFQAQQRKARGEQLTEKNRVANLNSINSSIKALSGALGDVELSDDTGLKSTLSSQLATAVKQRAEIVSGEGGIRRKLDTSTVEGFAATLKELGLNNEEIKTAATRKFAGSI